MHPKDMDAPPPTEKLKPKLVMPEADGRTSRGNTICSFHISSNGKGIKITINDHFFLRIFYTFVRVQQFWDPFLNGLISETSYNVPSYKDISVYM